MRYEEKLQHIATGLGHAQFQMLVPGKWVVSLPTATIKNQIAAGGGDTPCQAVLDLWRRLMVGSRSRVLATWVSGEPRSVQWDFAQRAWSYEEQAQLPPSNPDQLTMLE